MQFPHLSVLTPLTVREQDQTAQVVSPQNANIAQPLPFNKGAPQAPHRCAITPLLSRVGHTIYASGTHLVVRSDLPSLSNN